MSRSRNAGNWGNILGNIGQTITNIDALNRMVKEKDAERKRQSFLDDLAARAMALRERQAGPIANPTGGGISMIGDPMADEYRRVGMPPNLTTAPGGAGYNALAQFEPMGATAGPTAMIDALKLEEQKLKNQKLQKEIAAMGKDSDKFETPYNSYGGGVENPAITTVRLDNTLKFIRKGKVAPRKLSQQNATEFNTYDEFIAWFNQNKANLPQPDKTLAKAKAAFGVQ